MTDNPADAPRLRGWWRDFIEAVTQTEAASGAPTEIARLSQKSGFLPGFAATDASSKVDIRVLAPSEQDVADSPGVRDLGDEGENKNGHSVVLRLDYGERRMLLTGDLNERAQGNIMKHYGGQFADAWQADVAKACHHGSHHVDYGFLRGVSALSTVFSSGDANTYDHLRAWVLGAAALSGRVIEDPEHGRLKARLVYSTEVARSLSLKTIDQLREYQEPQAYGRADDAPKKAVSGAVTTSKQRVVLDRKSDQARDQPPVPDARIMRRIIYGLVNVRTDGERLLFAVRNEGNHTWAYETLEPDEIAGAVTMNPVNS